MIAGVSGVLCVFQPAMISAQGVPLRERGRPVGENAVPVGEHAVPVGEHAVPIGEGAVPLSQAGFRVGEGAVPTKTNGIPVGEGAVPTKTNGIPVGEGAVPTKTNGIPVGENAVPTKTNGIPVGENAVPTKTNGIPVGENAVPTKTNGIPAGEDAYPLDPDAAARAREARIRNRTEAMAHPQTSQFFDGDDATRRANANRNLATAASAEQTLNAASTAQQDVQDREWARAALGAAESRPSGLFSEDWWAAHPDVLDGPSRYFAAKSEMAWWQGSPWNQLIRVLGMNAGIKPFKYANDQNITFSNDVIYVNGQPVSSYEDFVATAKDLADARTPAAGTPGWFPLGVFVVSADADQKNASHAIQLAMDNVGNIAGVCVSWPEGKALPIRGQVDRNTQRVAFSIGGSDQAVVETGLSNLTEPNTRVWAHLPAMHSQTWLLARLNPGGE